MLLFSSVNGFWKLLFIEIITKEDVEVIGDL